MIACLLNFLSLGILLYDTLGYIAVYLNKEPTEEIKTDHNRLIHTWVFYLGLKYVSCYLGLGDSEFFLFEIIHLVLALVRLLITLPITGLSRMFTKTLIEDALACKLLDKVRSSVMAKVQEGQCAVETPSETAETKKE
mmetsp:Transcript_22974/g.23920  ORF Transcript_22974/g.23920 Transcript_22974/m.23920 type:complete len:138 (-) Transcript_22974:79-492(-)